MRTLAYATYDEVSDYLTHVNRLVPIPLWALRYIHRRFNASDRIRPTARGARRYSPLGDSRSARPCRSTPVVLAGGGKDRKCTWCIHRNQAGPWRYDIANRRRRDHRRNPCVGSRRSEMSRRRPHLCAGRRGRPSPSLIRDYKQNIQRR